MSQLPKIAQQAKTSTQGKGISLKSFIDDRILFSDAEDNNTETTEYNLPIREEDPQKAEWHTWALFYNHAIKLELIIIKDVIGRVDRECWIREYLEESGLTEKKEWWYDDDEHVIYLADEYFLMTWKMANCKQFEENVSCVVYSTNKST